MFSSDHRMFRGLVLLLGAAAITAHAAGPAAGSRTYEGIGRLATAKEVAAWDIDVRPDFKGLPKGSGSVQKGQQIWDRSCASCHGSFGESNEVFTPIVGGTRANDIKTGRVAALSDNSQPQRTTLMKLPTVSTLWDYINRAMPWTEPKSLSVDDVYAVTAYILNLGEIVPDDFVLSDQNIAEVQQRIPNRNGMTTRHGLWDVRGKPDVSYRPCMKDCKVETAVRSTLPPSAVSSHGNLADQNRRFGPVRGIVTAAAGKAQATASPAPAPAPATAGAGAADLAKQHACMACHGVASKIVGPGFAEVAAKYQGDSGAEQRLIEKMRNGGAGNWGSVPMPPQSGVPEADLRQITKWILAGAK